MTKLHRLAPAVALLLLGLACGDDPARPRATGSTDTTDRPASAEQVASDLGCGEVEELNEMIAPIRGGAAVRGVSCRKGTVEVDIFERSPVGDLDQSDETYAEAQAGSLENIDRLFGPGATDDPCRGWMLVGDAWIVVASDEALLKEAEADGALVGAVRPVQVMSPPASYSAPGTTGCG
jgi:hypothetical protein